MLWAEGHAGREAQGLQKGQGWTDGAGGTCCAGLR